MSKTDPSVNAKVDKQTAQQAKAPPDTCVGADQAHSIEREHIDRVREAMAHGPEAGSPFPAYTGLCLSGGGIRSASFAIGFMQALAECRLLSRFDYISAVSGGGYALGWWTALVSRIETTDSIGPTEQIVIAKARVAERLIAPDYLEPATGTLTGPKGFEVRHARAHGNYLTLRTGLLSADTWSAVFIILRNLVYGLSGLGFLAIVLAWLVLELARYTASAATTHAEWFALAASAPLCIGWARTCLAMNRDTLNLDGSLNLSFTIGLLILGALLASLFLVAMPAQLGGKLFGVAAFDAALAILLALSLVEAALWFKGFFSTQSNWKDRLRKLRFNLATVLMFTGIALPSLAWAFQFAQPLRTWANTYALQFYLLWLMALMSNTWEWSREIGVMRIASNAGELNRFKFNSLLVSGLVMFVLCIVLTELAPRLMAVLRPPGLQTLWIWTGLTSAMLTSFGVLTNALVTVSDGSQADPIHREWWARWSSELMIGSAVTLATCVLVSMTLNYHPSGTAILWCGAATLFLFGTSCLTVVGTPLRLVLRTAGLLAVSGVAITAFLIARAIGPLYPDLFATTEPLLVSTPFLAPQNSQGILASLGLDVAPWPVAMTIFLLAAVSLLVLLRSGPNTFSMHELYRNRLVRAFLGASTKARKLVPTVEFAKNDDPLLTDLIIRGTSSQKSTAVRPFPIWCAAVNATTARQLGLLERKAASFVFTPLHCGLHVDSLERAPNTLDRRIRSDVSMAPTSLHSAQYERTSKEFEPEPLTIGAAIATSAAAFSSNTGATTTPERALVLTLLGLRLGRWFPNPAVCRKPDRSDPSRPDNAWMAGMPVFVSNSANSRTERLRNSLMPLLIREAFSQCDISADAVYVTDGGHFENLGVYELLRRRAKLIVCVDAGCDPNFEFQDLLNLQAKARSDFGVEIEISGLEDLVSDKNDRRASTWFKPWNIVYSRTDSGAHDEVGVLIYCKSTLTGTEPADLLAYRRRVPSFPHINTINQWFAESAFEAYRSLGLHIGRQVAAMLNEKYASRRSAVAS